MYFWEQLLTTFIVKYSTRMIDMDCMELSIEYSLRFAHNYEQFCRSNRGTWWLTWRLTQHSYNIACWNINRTI